MTTTQLSCAFVLRFGPHPCFTGLITYCNTSTLAEAGPSCAVAPPFKQKAGWLIFKWLLFVFLLVPCVHVSPV